MKAIDPHVKCLAIMDEREAAWKTSRPNIEDTSLGGISAMDFSLNSMKVYTLEFRSSILFRDLVFSLRPIDGWALSSRAVPATVDSVQLSSEFGSNTQDYNSILDMLNLVDNGVNQDKARELLPMSTSTMFTVTMNHRVLMGFLKSIHEINNRLFDLYGKMILDAVDGWDDFKISKVSPVHKFCTISANEFNNKGLSLAGDMIFGCYNMKIALSSQFLRQHYSKIKIEWWNLASDYFGITTNQSGKVYVAFYIDKEAYAKLMSIRAHWVADWSIDMWGELVGDYIGDMSSEAFWEFLPNGGGRKDPYFEDSYNRILRKDPGLPCPIMCEWPELIDIRKQQIGNSVVLWQYEKLVHNGYIKDNPKNEHRMKYINTKETE